MAPKRFSQIALTSAMRDSSSARAIFSLSYLANQSSQVATAWARRVVLRSNLASASSKTAF